MKKIKQLVPLCMAVFVFAMCMLIGGKNVEAASAFKVTATGKNVTTEAGETVSVPITFSSSDKDLSAIHGEVNGGYDSSILKFTGVTYEGTAPGVESVKNDNFGYATNDSFSKGTICLNFKVLKCTDKVQTVTVKNLYFTNHSYKDSDAQEISVKITVNHPKKSQKIETVKATCVANGSKKVRCGFCNTLLSKEVLKATGHKYGSWKTKSAATISSPKVQERACTVCGKKETRKVGSKLTPTGKVNATSITLQVKQATSKVKVSGLAKGDSVKKWSSSNTKVVKVSQKGVITAQNKTGTATVTITLKSGKTLKVKVTVQKSAVKTTSITGIPSSITVKKGKTYTLSPSLKPITSVQKITYSSKNTKIAKVNSKGVITAVKKGTTTITVKAGTKTQKCTITVK